MSVASDLLVAACPERVVSVSDLDASIIAPGLWQGGVAPFDGCSLAIDDVDVVVLLECHAGVTIKPEPIKIDVADHVSALDHLDVLHSTARYVACRLKNGDSVLVLCHHGRNRSGLLVGLALNELGVPGWQAVEHIKASRRKALSNEDFARYLETLS